MRMPPKVVAVLLLLATPAPALGQTAAPDSAARRTAMARLGFLAGSWEGSAWYQTAQGRRDSLWQTEDVRFKLRGQVLIIEGLGRRGIPSAPGDTVFNAVAVVDWLPERGYAMRSHTLEGRSGTFPLQLSDSGFVWGLEVPGGQVRYTMQLTATGQWHERGEFSRDGERWFPTFEMRLRRTGP